MQTMRIFPHDPAVFPSVDDLTTWLLTALKAKGGKYRVLGTAPQAVPANLLQGSVVLFRYADLIVGEAVVLDYIIPAPIEETAEQCLAIAIFAPSSIRLYSPPVDVERLSELIGGKPDISVHRTYHSIENWTVYPKLLAHVAASGAFL